MGKVGWSKLKLTEIDMAMSQQRDIKKRETSKNRLASLSVMAQR
jgi:hypothetical protein